MSTGAPAARSGRAVALPAAAERGATVIPDRVVARLATHAAREALTRLATGALRPDAGAARAQASVRAGAARLEVRVDLPYPIDISSAAEAVQRHVAEQVEELTGLSVHEVDLTVRNLYLAKAAGRVA
ncbi:Asp23/Gls24 family envelope stress response protein [Kitasatospora sp. NPDC085895]|uniref:Asp23/Gls24 family envelope stress response protein n=1 Tax=Kitasatospora sp. NPDC085895 TaxID=3155057 RepID=UPI003450E2DF